MTEEYNKNKPARDAALAAAAAARAEIEASSNMPMHSDNVWNIRWVIY